MAIIEVVFPHLKGPGSLDKLETNPFPYLLEQLRAVGILGMRRGSITTDNGKDVSGDFRDTLLVEYPDAPTFYNFIASPEFAVFKDKVKGGVTAPPTLKLFEASSGLENVGEDPSLEMILLSPKTGNDLTALLTEIKSLAKGATGARAIFGTNLKAEENEVFVLESYENSIALEQAQQQPARQIFLSKLREVASVTQLFVNIKKVDV